MSAPEFTRFPNLSSTVLPPDGDFQYHEIAIAELNVPEEVLLLCWAQLLSSYTGYDEVVFVFDDHLVQVLVEHSSIRKHKRSQGPLEGHRNATGVFKKDVRIKYGYTIYSNNMLTLQSQPIHLR